MKLKILFSAIIICFYITACKSEKAKHYSDLVVQKEKIAENDIQSATQKLQGFFVNDEFDSIVNISNRTEENIEHVIADIRNTKTPNLKEAENFKQETIKYLEYKKQLFETYKNYGLQTTPQGRELLRQNMTAMLSQEKIFNSNIEAAQINFARANHVKIK